MAISVSMIALSSQLVVAVANGVPVFDVTRTCRLDLAATAGLSNTQSVQACLMDENRAKQKLGSQWSKYPASSKAMYPAGKRRRHSKLCKFANVPANESVGSLVCLR